MWRRIVWNVPSLYASTLSGMNWKDNERPTVDEVATLLGQNEDSLIPYVPVYLLWKKLTQKFEEKEIKLSNSPTCTYQYFNH